jgi:hypothetical protein
VSEAQCSFAVQTLAAGLDADDLHVLVVEERMEQPDRVGAAADAATSMSGSGLRPSIICSRVSLPITDWKSRTISG